MTDIVVDTPGSRIAVRDFGGAGPDVLLLPGGGGNLLHWTGFVPLLAGFRLVAMDLRGHGHSGDGPFTVPANLSDVDAVVAALGLRNPAVVGASLGGALAVHWAKRHPDTPAIVNLDGHGHPTGYPGAAPKAIAAARAKLAEMFDAQAEAMAAPLTAEQVDAMTEQQREMAATLGADPEAFAAAFGRGVREVDGQWWLRPGGANIAELRALIDAQHVPDLYADLPCPCLAVVAGRPLPGQEAFAELLTAQGRGVLADLRALAERNPNVRPVEFDGSHAMMFERPDRLAEMVRTFLANRSGA